ncbi:hypothetical protein PCANC_27794 [Puccinia coronata f. sp. avenae]|uniref:Uncharacterized protein n=1 Tax=Puccinia coronata f. sp. avenae TaxID=200324 RepID=A0A2N5TLL8_9BASI|nr:hypothetical protein PCANC_27794 [Puccinia coronata f. sp. avenae]PLW27105.1 hypothetical protein PCASD_23492 [Puccinia coronata f. sp. avenae]
MSNCTDLDPLLGTVDEDNDFIDFLPSPTVAQDKSLVAESQNKGVVAQEKKAENYQAQEDVELCRAWAHVTEDPAIGTNQDGNAFWEQITKCYTKAHPYPP